MPNRRAIQGTLANRVHRVYGNACAKCKISEDGLEIHHILPVVYGGGDGIDNLALLCSVCHKHAPDDPESFKEYIKDELNPTFESSALMVIAACEYISNLDDKGIAEFRSMGGVSFYIEKMKPNFINIQRMIYRIKRVNPNTEL